MTKNRKPSIGSYKKLNRIAEEILKEKGQATSNEIVNCIVEEYKTNNLSVNSRSITSHFKKCNFPHERKHKGDKYIFTYVKKY